MRIFKRMESAAKMLAGGHFSTFISQFEAARESMVVFNLYPRKKTCRYIVLGGHGMGLNAVEYYLRVMEANAASVFGAEFIRPFYFTKGYDGIVLDKLPKAKSARRILSSIDSRVPCYQIVRDPISMIKSCLNASIFHRLNTMHTHQDIEELLMRLLKDISHLIFHFASMKDLVKNQISDFTYWDQKAITSDLESTLNSFSDRFGYKRLNTVGGGDCVIKGSAFYRCFPYIFERLGGCFALYPDSRENKPSELDMANHLEKTKKTLPKTTFHLRDFIVSGYEDSPLHLVAWDLNSKQIYEKNTQEIDALAKQEIDAILKILEKYDSMALSENQVLDLMIKNPNAKNLASRIHSELRYIRQERPDILQTFKYTADFLAELGLDIMK